VPGSVTVVIPCYNYGRYLRECVSSVLTQGVDLDIDIIDDASTDDTESVGSALAAEDERVTYHRHERNIGHIATYNEGLGRAGGIYSILLSADDMLAPGALGRAIGVLDENPDVVLFHGKHAVFRDTPPETASGRRPGVRIWEGQEFIEHCCREVWNPVSCPTVIVRTSAQKSVGGYIASLPHSGDMEMWLRLATRGRVAELRGVVQAFYRVHETNMHKNLYYDFLVNDRQLRAAYETFFAGSAAFMDNRDELRRQCARAFSERGIWWSYLKLCKGQLRGAWECLRYSVSAWRDCPEDNVHMWKVRDVVEPISYAVHQRQRRRREAQLNKSKIRLVASES
jgi:glycosyltransferase involved in cell wall biosynthesis